MRVPLILTFSHKGRRKKDAFSNAIAVDSRAIRHPPDLARMARNSGNVTMRRVARAD